jgi:hypothetical protein
MVENRSLIALLRKGMVLISLNRTTRVIRRAIAHVLAMNLMNGTPIESLDCYF